MKLFYRGARYNNQSADVPTAEAAINTQFLGNSYPVCQPLQLATGTNAALTYRGIVD